LLNQRKERIWRLEFGARPVSGGMMFRVWAPSARHLSVKIKSPRDALFAMERDDDGVFQALVPDLPAGSDYFYVIDGQKERPDPVSRFQPHGVHGPSRVIDPESFEWTDREWKGLALEDYLTYELHTGTFTPDGTFAAIIDKLPYLREVGITAVELMPVVEFPGARNWGYDGVYLYAPHSAYGGPVRLKRLIDACHARGLAVILDVVYNHLGPEGNYLGEYGPYFTNRYRSPWGNAVNFDGPLSDGVRRLFVDNALYWLDEYHFDALRLDAIHGIFDFGARHILQEIGEAFHEHARALGRRAWLIAESDLNDVRVIKPIEAGGYGLDAQWNDDFHHSLHTVLTGARHGYFADFGRLEDLRKALVEGFVYDGRRSIFRRRRHGSSSKDRPGCQFVVFNQNHDQVANASAGTRIAKLVSVEQQKLAAMVLICAPNLPLIFMGQEFGATTPFLYFTSFIDPELARAVSEGRKKEYASFLKDKPFSDPQSPETFARSRLQWDQAGHAPHSQILAFHRDLIALRKKLPCLSNCRKDLTRVEFSEEPAWMTIERGAAGAGADALVVCNFNRDPQTVPILARAPGWRLALWSGDPKYAGPPEAPRPAPIIGPENTAVTLGGYSAALYVEGRDER
jgi:maltooligosyltrehalose trehalohydrolase